jgi:hypothetical protein
MSMTTKACDTAMINVQFKGDKWHIAFVKQNTVVVLLHHIK